MSGKRARGARRTVRPAGAAGAGAGAPAPGPGARLAAWFRRRQRDLPWRGPYPRDPYRVLVSEIMAQQTQVARAAPAFARFLERFPTVADLAAAPVEAVLAAFSGLGYYRRARLLHEAARALAARGGWPRDVVGLRALPGLGAYTAAAVAAFAFGGDEPPVDGNVARVAARRLALDQPLGSAALGRAARELAVALHRDAPSPVIFEALMELGATVCVPDAPRCGDCPLADGCAARGAGAAARYPRPRRGRAAEDHEWIALWLTRPDGAVLLRRVDEGPLLRGLWLPPFAPLEPGADPAAAAVRLARACGHRGALAPGAAVRHGITHRRITVRPFAGAAAADRARDGGPADDGLGWYDAQAPGVATSSLLDKVRRACAAAAPAAAERRERHA